jgi:hypothetical protein
MSDEEPSEEDGEYVRFDERDDVLASLELVAVLAGEAAHAPRHWKWLILAAHNALQGALVCALSGSDGTGALTDHSRREWLEAYDRDADFPKERLADLKTLLKRERQQNSHPNDRECALCSTEKQHRDLIRLCGFRDDFTHFKAGGWSIEASGLPRIVWTAVDAAGWVMLRNSKAGVHLSDEQRERIRECVDRARRALKPPETT